MSRMIAIVGLGYVGLPLAATFIDQGFRVIGIDKDESKLRMLEAGQSYIADVPNEKVERWVQTKQLRVTPDFHMIAAAEAVIICVPTPLTEHQTPDLSPLMDAAKRIGEHLRPGQLVSLESSTYPGTTKEVLLPLLAARGLRIGQDFFVGFSPERVDPGNSKFPLPEIPKVISGITEACAARMEELYQIAFRKIVRVSSTETAEMTKLLENTFRFINISFINEFAIVCDKLGINVWEVIAAASSKPFGFTPFSPGPGVGGHCIPVDPLYLQWKTRQLGLNTSFIDISARLNDEMPRYVADRIREELQRPVLEGAHILVIGVTFKENIADIRESSAIEVIRLLLAQGAAVDYHDPLISEIVVDGIRLKSVALDAQQLQAADCVVVAVNHRGLPLREIAEHAALVFDTRNALSEYRSKDNIVTLGDGKAGKNKRPFA